MIVFALVRSIGGRNQQINLPEEQFKKNYKNVALFCTRLLKSETHISMVLEDHMFVNKGTRFRSQVRYETTSSVSGWITDLRTGRGKA